MSSNGHSDTKTLKYNKVKFDPNFVRPDAPEGEWEATIVRGKSKVAPVQSGNNQGDPMLSIQVRLDSAADEANEHAQGTILTKRIMFPDDSNPKTKVFVSRRSKQDYNDLCRATGTDPDIRPVEMEDPEEDLKPLIEAVEGKSITMWTSHRKKPDGSISVEVNFRAPGSFNTPAGGRDSDEE